MESAVDRSGYSNKKYWFQFCLHAYEPVGLINVKRSEIEPRCKLLIFR